MAFSIPDQSKFPGIAETETVFELDSGHFVAVRVECTVEPHSGNPVFAAYARVVNGEGYSVMDGAGSNTLVSSISHHSNPTELKSLSKDGLVKQVVLAVLGEETSIWKDPLHSSVMECASVRVNIASSDIAGTVSDLASIL